MSFDLRARMSITDNFSGTIKRATRSFESLWDTIDRTNNSIGKLGREMAFANMETGRLAREMSGVSRETKDAAISTLGLGAAMHTIDRSPLTSMTASFPVIAAGAAAATAAIAPLGAAAGGLASSFGAAAAGAGAFGVVATSVLGKVFDSAEEVDKLNEKIASAGSAKEMLAAQKELSALYGDMSKSQRGALQDLQEFKGFWGGFTKEFETPIFSAFSEGLDATKGLLTGMKPAISGVATAVNDIVANLNSSISGGGFQKFFDWMETNAARSLTNFATMAGNTMSGLFGILDAFAPVGARVETSLVSMTEKFKAWGEGLKASKSFETFLNYARTNGPPLLATFENIGVSIGKMITTIAPLGSTLLSGLASFTGFIRSNFETLVPIIAGVTAAFAAQRAIMAGMAIVGTLAKLFQSYTLVAGTTTVAQWALNTAMSANPIGLLVVGIGALVAAGVALYRSWDVVKEKAGQLWSWLTDKFSGIKTSTLETWGSVKESIGGAMDSAKTKVEAFFSPLLDFLKDAKGLWNDFTGALSNFKMPKISMPSFGVSNILSGIPGFSKGIERVPGEMPAILHSNESVLTADQSNVLRGMGVLRSNGGRPEINTEPLTKTRYKMARSTQASNGGNTYKFGDININGANKTTKEMARELVDNMKYAISNGALA